MNSAFRNTNPKNGSLSQSPTSRSRRQFVLETLFAAAAFEIIPSGFAQGASRQIKLGVVGNGGRGSWIAQLFKQNGGFEMHAVADYFPEVADKCGENLGVPQTRRFSTLSGFKRLLESGVEAVALEVPPYFLPEYAAAAVEAGVHVYMAKPAAVDVPGALKVLAAGKKATEKKLCFMVDYQMPTDPVNIEVQKKIRTSGFGKIVHVWTTGLTTGFIDPPGNLESRLRNLTWVNDTAMGCGYIGNYDIHAIDAALWAIGEVPIGASGNSRVSRVSPHGDAHDVCSVLFDYPGGVIHSHFGEALNNKLPGELSCQIHGTTGHALLNYWGKSSFRSFDDAMEGEVANLYEAGANRNISTFYKNVIEGHFENGTVQRSVDGVLACVLGREAGLRQTRLTMETLLKENKKLDVDLSGLKA